MTIRDFKQVKIWSEFFCGSDIVYDTVNFVHVCIEAPLSPSNGNLCQTLRFSIGTNYSKDPFRCNAGIYVDFPLNSLYIACEQPL